MTREEAISTLRNVAWLGTDKKVGQVEEALQMAITALQTDGDCISRTAVISMLRNGAVAVTVDGTMDTYDAVGEIVTQVKEFFAECVEDLPSVQPDNSCDGCRYENADDGVIVPCGFCKRSHSDNYERRTDG